MQYMYIYISPQWLCDNSWTWAYDVRSYIYIHSKGTLECPQRTLLIIF